MAEAALPSDKSSVKYIPQEKILGNSESSTTSQQSKDDYDKIQEELDDLTLSAPGVLTVPFNQRQS